MADSSTKQRRSRRRRQTHALRAPRPLVILWQVLRRTLSACRESLIFNSLPLLINLAAASLWWYSIPVLSGGIDQFKLYWFENTEQDEALTYTFEVYKQLTQFFGYALASALMLGRIREFLVFIRWERSLVVLLGLLAATSIVSDYPVKVFTNCFHLAFGFVSIWLFCRHPVVRQSPSASSFVLVLIPTLAIQLLNLLIWLVHPEASWSELFTDRRMGGLGGNPNTLGAISLVSVWALTGLMCRSSFKERMWWIQLSLLAVVLFNLMGTGSATAQTLSGIIVLAMVGNLFYISLAARNRIILIMGCTTIALGLVFYLLTMQSGSDITSAATGAVGKDVTLTGRVDLWEIGISAFIERPVFGWGYDGHQTVFEDPRFGIGHNHYHSGVIDTLVNGGVVGLLAVLFVLKQFFSRFLTLKGRGERAFPMLVIIVVGVVHNLTEYSIFRPNITLWSVWTLAFMSVAVSARQELAANDVTVRRRRKRTAQTGTRTRAASW